MEHGWFIPWIGHQSVFTDELSTPSFLSVCIACLTFCVFHHFERDEEITPAREGHASRAKRNI